MAITRCDRNVGSGKSTLVDARLAYCSTSKISFTRPLCGKNERNLATYVRGEYKNTKNDDSDTTRERSVSLRYNDPKSATFSVILANFTNEDYHDSVALAQVFWIENDKVQKLLIIREKEPLSIKDHFSDMKITRVAKTFKGLRYTDTFEDNFCDTANLPLTDRMQTDKAMTCSIRRFNES